MRVLVCGGRRFNDALTLGSWLGSIHKNNGPITLLIEGGASGADFMARKFAEWQGIPVQTFDADWSRYGKKAGPLRNRQMIGEGRPDKVIGFEGGTGRPNDRRSQSRCAGFEREIEQLAICGWRCAVSEEVAGEGRGRCAPMRCISLCAKCAVWSVMKTFPGVTCALKLRESISALEDGIGMEVAIFGPAISAFAGVVGAFLGLFMTTKNTQRTLAANAQLNQVAAKERANEREARNYGDQLERFYIPYRLLASANFMLAQELRERLKHGERFFIKIFDKEWLNSLAEGDREIIQMICANADVLKGMIEQKITPVDMKLLPYLARAVLHYSMLTRAYAGTLGKDPSGLRRYAYPRSLDAVLDIEIKRINDRIQLLRSDPTGDHPAMPELQIPEHLKLDPWPDPAPEMQRFRHA